MAKQSAFGTPMKVEGAAELARLMRRIGDRDLKRSLRDANKAGATLVAEDAKEHHVPVQSGRLKRSIGARGTQTEGKVKAGTASRVPYAGPIHFGWGRRNIRAQPFLHKALSKKFRDHQLQDTYEREIRAVIAQLETKGIRTR